MKKGSKISKSNTAQNTNKQLLKNVLNGLELEKQKANALRDQLESGEKSPLIAHFHPRNHLAQLHSKHC